MMADDIPVAHTPPGGYGDEFPPPILAGCTEPLVAGAPDLRGTWRVVSATRGGAPVPDGDPLLGYTERIEQCSRCDRSACPASRSPGGLTTTGT